MNIKIILLCFIAIYLLGCKTKSTKIEVVTLVKTSNSWNGDALPKYLEGKPEITILKITIPAKTKLELHKHSEINAGVLLKGKLKVISESKDTLYLNAGDPIVELVDKWHYGENNENEPAEIIVFYAGIKGTPITTIK